MTVKSDIVVWDNGIDRLCLLKVSDDRQYSYIDGVRCITFDVCYEKEDFKGRDTFTLFDPFYTKAIANIKNAYTSLNGSFRIDDNGADTDGYFEVVMLKNGSLSVKGQLGSSYSSHMLLFEFEADQTLVKNLLQGIAF